MRYSKLRDARNETNYSVAKATGISNGSFDDWKKDKYVPSTKSLMKLAKYFGVTVDYFLGD